MLTSKRIMIVFIAVFIGVATYMWLGFYNIAADNKHWSATESLIGVVRDNAISRATSDITIPKNLDEISFYVKAAGNYAQMCSSCHLAPSIKNSEMRIGLYPQPPDLTKTNSKDPTRDFWVIKHGIKMTGMPAWGKSHSDEEIWELVAFINQLPKLDKNQYKELVNKYAGSHQHSNGHHGSTQNESAHNHDHDDHKH